MGMFDTVSLPLFGSKASLQTKQFDCDLNQWELGSKINGLENDFSVLFLSSSPTGSFTDTSSQVAIFVYNGVILDFVSASTHEELNNLLLEIRPKWKSAKFREELLMKIISSHIAQKSVFHPLRETLFEWSQSQKCIENPQVLSFLPVSKKHGFASNKKDLVSALNEDSEFFENTRESIFINQFLLESDVSSIERNTASLGSRDKVTSLSKINKKVRFSLKRSISGVLGPSHIIECLYSDVLPQKIKINKRESNLCDLLFNSLGFPPRLLTILSKADPSFFSSSDLSFLGLPGYFDSLKDHTFFKNLNLALDCAIKSGNFKGFKEILDREPHLISKITPEKLATDLQDIYMINIMYDFISDLIVFNTELAKNTVELIKNVPNSVRLEWMNQIARIEKIELENETAHLAIKKSKKKKL